MYTEKRYSVNDEIATCTLQEIINENQEEPLTLKQVNEAERLSIGESMFIEIAEIKRVA